MKIALFILTISFIVFVSYLIFIAIEIKQIDSFCEDSTLKECYNYCEEKSKSINCLGIVGAERNERELLKEIYGEENE